MVPTNVEKTKCYPYVSLENDSQAMVKFSLTYFYQVGEHKITIQSTEWMWLPALPNCAQKILLSNSGSLYLTKLSDLVYRSCMYVRQDPIKSGEGTQSFSTTPYSLCGSSKFPTCCSGIYVRWIQLAPLWQSLNFYLKHPHLSKLKKKLFNFWGAPQG